MGCGKARKIHFGTRSGGSQSQENVSTLEARSGFQNYICGAAIVAGGSSSSDDEKSDGVSSSAHSRVHDPSCGES